jgi:hypothetical protein
MFDMLYAVLHFLTFVIEMRGQHIHTARGGPREIKLDAGQHHDGLVDSSTQMGVSSDLMIPRITFVTAYALVKLN